VTKNHPKKLNPMNQFFKQVFASFIGSVAGLIFIFSLGTGGFLFLLISLAMSEDRPTLKNKSVLVFDLSTQVRDTEPPTTLGKILSETEDTFITLRQILEVINQATKDDQIVAILLDGRKSNASNGFATTNEVKQALENFKASGKKIIAYHVDQNEKDYYLSSIADRIILNPMGAIEVNGLASEQMFLAGTFEKYGIDVQVVRVGNYKSAVENFTRENFSNENRQQTSVLLTGLWRELLTGISQKRQLETGKLQNIADTKGLVLAQESQNLGMVDQIAYFDTVIDDLIQLTGVNKDTQSFHQVSLSRYLTITESKKKTSRNKIAIIYAEGEIVDGEGQLQEIGGESFAKELRKIRNDDEVKGVILRVNSPGGSATASDIIWRELQILQEKSIPVVVSMGDVAASGGYWISMASDYIFAESSTITGSIGVFGILPNIQQLGNNNGLNWDVVKTGQLADIQTIARPKTEAELRIYQQYVNQIYELFLTKVAEARKLPREKVAQIAQGRVWSGDDAKKLGLIDEIGGLQAAIEYVTNQANLGTDWEIVEYPKISSFEERLMKRLFGSQVTPEMDPLTQEFVKFKEEIKLLQTLNDPKGIYARLPFNITIK
jgi:protease-4